MTTKDELLLKVHYMPMKRLIKADDVDAMSARIDADPAVLHLETSLGGWLHIAAKAGALKCAAELLRRGVDVNRHYNSQLGGALNVACNAGNDAIVDLLLKWGAVPETAHPDFNPLFSAVRAERPDIAQRLVKAGLDPAAAYEGGWNARQFAERMGKKTMADWIRDHGG